MYVYEWLNQPCICYLHAASRQLRQLPVCWYLALCVTRAFASRILTIWDILTLVQISLTCTISISEVIENADTFMIAIYHCINDLYVILYHKNSSEEIQHPNVCSLSYAFARPLGGVRNARVSIMWYLILGHFQLPYLSQTLLFMCCVGFYGIWRPLGPILPSWSDLSSEWICNCMPSKVRMILLTRSQALTRGLIIDFIPHLAGHMNAVF